MSSVVKIFFTVGWYSIAYRLIAIVRDTAIASTFGTSFIGDAFVACVKFTNLIRKILIEGTFNAAFLPKFSSFLKNKEEAEIFGSKMFSALFSFATVLVFCVICCYPILANIYASGFNQNPEQMNAFVAIGRYASPFIGAGFVFMMFSGVLNSINKFALAAAVQSFFSIAIIFGAIFGTLFYTNDLLTIAKIMGFSIALSGLLEIAILWYNTEKNGIKIRFVRHFVDDDVKYVFKKLFSSGVGSGVRQINNIVTAAFASTFGVGSVSYLYYGDHVIYLPLMFGLTMSAALLPVLSKNVHEENHEEQFKNFNQAIKMSIGISLPLTVAVWCLSEIIVDGLYGYGKFDQTSVFETAKVVRLLALTIPAYIFSKVFSSVFFAKKMHNIALRCGIVSIIVNIVCLFTSKVIGFMALVLATVISEWAYLVGLMLYFNRHKSIKYDKNNILLAIKVCIASAVLYFLSPFLLDLNCFLKLYMPKSISSFLVVLLAIGIGSVYLLIQTINNKK